MQSRSKYVVFFDGSEYYTGTVVDESRFGYFVVSERYGDFWHCKSSCMFTDKLIETDRELKVFLRKIKLERVKIK